MVDRFSILYASKVELKKFLVLLNDNKSMDYNERLRVFLLKRLIVKKLNLIEIKLSKTANNGKHA